MEKHRVSLTDKEQRKLVAIVTKGRNKASYIQRAHILLKSADGKTDAEISQWLYISESTVRRTRLRFCETGIDAALEDEAPTEREPLLNEQQEGHRAGTSHGAAVAVVSAS
jgi:DNA-directed RNA polymerase specialized sigma24 family protein